MKILADAHNQRRRVKEKRLQKYLSTMQPSLVFNNINNNIISVTTSDSHNHQNAVRNDCNIVVGNNNNHFNSINNNITSNSNSHANNIILGNNNNVGSSINPNSIPKANNIINQNSNVTMNNHINDNVVNIDTSKRKSIEPNEATKKKKRKKVKMCANTWKGIEPSSISTTTKYVCEKCSNIPNSHLFHRSCSLIAKSTGGDTYKFGRCLILQAGGGSIFNHPILPTQAAISSIWLSGGWNKNELVKSTLKSYPVIIPEQHGMELNKGRKKLGLEQAYNQSVSQTNYIPYFCCCSCCCFWCCYCCYYNYYFYYD